jgi:phage terminase small subunit
MTMANQIDQSDAARAERFCQEYMVDHNGKQAAIRVGYSPRSAHVQASRMLSKANIQARIAELSGKIRESTMITAERALEEYAKIGFLQLDVRKLFDEQGNLIPIQDLDDAAAAQIAGVEVSEIVSEQLGTKEAPRVVLTRIRKIRLHPIGEKKAALDSMARHLGMFKDTVRLEVNPIRELMDYIANNPVKLPAKP